MIALRPSWTAIERFATSFVDLALPHRCAMCGSVLGAERGVCGGCWAQLSFIAEPVCSVCGRPRTVDETPVDPCVRCRAHPPLLRRTRAALAYDDASRRLVIAFKHHARLSLRPLLVRWLRRAAADLIDEVDLVAPVPLHRHRLLHRGYNQAAVLAAPLADRAAHYVPDLLIKRRSTRPQQGLGAQARASNVTARAFQINPRWQAQVKGRRVLLVDDVVTTGATLDACGRVLARGGVASVDGVCLARVTRPDRPPI